MIVMKALNPTSLGDQVSKEISAWILILVATIVVVLFLVSFILSSQMFNKQVNIWKIAAPQYALTSLMDSDHFSIDREVSFIKSTGLFSSFVITDNQKQVISQFGSDKISDSSLIPIHDDAQAIWGYYYFQPNFYKFFSPFLAAAVIFLALILIVYFAIRWRMRSNLESEFSRFNNFLAEIEMVTEKLHEIYNPEDEFQINSKSTYNTEQVIINRAISKLLHEIQKANQSLREAISAAEKRRFQEELTRAALQVAHDIGSPLAALEAILQSTSLALPEKSRTPIRNAAGRIRDISNTLLQKARQELTSNDEGPLSQHLLLSLINQVVSEKRMQHDEKISIKTQFDNSSYKLFALIRSADFCRVLSNLINNAIEAIENSGHITVFLLNADKNIEIRIQDNGKGIPDDILGKLGELGKTHGKPDGLGIGLHHAINAIDNWGGRLDIQSQEGVETTVQITLPKSQPPSWFVPEIKIMDGQTIVIIDDDESIHDVWKERFREYQNKINLFHFYSPEELISWNNNTKDCGIMYLCDHEFIGNSMNGIDLITKLKINYLSILVTSGVTHEVTSSCEIKGIKLLPKDIANIVPITINSSLDQLLGEKT
jgi:signal transduction histidine kinase